MREEVAKPVPDRSLYSSFAFVIPKLATKTSWEVLLTPRAMSVNNTIIIQTLAPPNGMHEEV
jgi:hypothetical protein